MARQPTYQLKLHATGQWFINYQGSKKYFGADRAQAEKRKARFLAALDSPILACEPSDKPGGLASFRVRGDWQPPADCKDEYDELFALLEEDKKAKGLAEEAAKPDDGGRPLKYALELWNHYAEVRGRADRTKEEKETYYALFRKYMQKHFRGVSLLGLRREHFKGFRDYCLSKWGRKSPIKCNKALQLTGEVLRRAYKEEPDVFPDGLFAGLELIKERVPYAPAPFNEVPYPADEFRALVEACDKPEDLRDKCLLHCLVNFGLDLSDVSALCWKHLKLDGELPLFDMTRAKYRNRVNERYTRRIVPIALTTLGLLKKWKAACKGKPDGSVFIGKRGTALTAVGLNNSNGFLNRLKRRAVVKSRYSPKHFRNVGSNLAREAGMKLDDIDYFLGHTIDSEARKYLSAEASAKLSLPLVELIEERYFRPAPKKAAKKAKRVAKAKAE